MPSPRFRHGRQDLPPGQQARSEADFHAAFDVYGRIKNLQHKVVGRLQQQRQQLRAAAAGAAAPPQQPAPQRQSFLEMLGSDAALAWDAAPASGAAAPPVKRQRLEGSAEPSDALGYGGEQPSVPSQADDSGMSGLCRRTPPAGDGPSDSFPSSLQDLVAGMGAGGPPRAPSEAASGPAAAGEGLAGADEEPAAALQRRCEAAMQQIAAEQAAQPMAYEPSSEFRAQTDAAAGGAAVPGSSTDAVSAAFDGVIALQAGGCAAPAANAQAAEALLHAVKSEVQQVERELEEGSLEWSAVPVGTGVRLKCADRRRAGALAAPSQADGAGTASRLTSSATGLPVLELNVPPGYPKVPPVAVFDSADESYAAADAAACRQRFLQAVAAQEPAGLSVSSTLRLWLLGGSPAAT